MILCDIFRSAIGTTPCVYMQRRNSGYVKHYCKICS